MHPVNRIVLNVGRAIGWLVVALGVTLFLAGLMSWITGESHDVSAFSSVLLGTMLFTAPSALHFGYRAFSQHRIGRDRDDLPVMPSQLAFLFISAGLSLLTFLIALAVYLVYIRG